MTYLGLLVHGLALAVVASGIAKLIDDSVAGESVRTAAVPVLANVERPGRVVGAAEIVIGMTTIAIPVVVGPAALAGLYAGFAWFVIRLRKRDPAASCGCIGSAQVPPGALHVAVSVAASLICVAGVIDGAPDVTEAFGDLPNALVYAGTTIPVALMTLYIPALTNPAPRDGY